MSRARFFHKDECPFCWKARIALAEAGIDYDLVTLGPGDDRSELERHSPTGSTPVLVTGGLAIWESAVIVEYANHVMAGGLLPQEPDAAAQARLLQAYSDAQIGCSLREVIFEKRDKPEADWDRDRIDAGERGWRQCLGWLSGQLGDKEFFAGAFSLAECALLPRFALARRYGVGVDDRHPNLLRWFEAVRQRSSCRETQPASWTGA